MGTVNKNSDHRLELQTFGSDHHWIRAGAVAIRSGELTLLRRKCKIVEKWAKCFEGQICKMSDRFLRTLAQFGLHNMRGSDEATELLIAVTVKALAEEVGMLLPGLNLSHGCPSRRTLARGEKRLLRLDEMKNLVAQGKARDGIKPGDVKYIVPCSAEMVALVTAINRNE